MDQRSNRPGGLAAPKKAYTIALKDQNTQSCNRTGCRERTKNTQNTRIGSLVKVKCSDPSFHPPIGNEITRKSSGSSSMITSAKKPYLDSKRKLSSRAKFDPSASRISAPSASRSSAVGPFNRCNGDGLRNLKCNSISDVVPVGKKMMMKKRSLEGESSSSRTERKTTSTSMTVNTRTRLYSRRNGRNSSSVREPAVVLSEIPDRELSSVVGGGSLSMHFSARGSRSYVSSSDGESPPNTMDFASEEAGFMRLMDNDVLRGYNMGGIAEMLLALESIEQEEELTHEDLLVLETSLSFGSLNLYDQHREMRMDIDNMSYEELLALEERMGTVSTALSEDDLSKCLKRSVYQAAPSEVQITGLCEDGYESYDIKCSICQEVYVTGEEIGALVKCQHGYHKRCVSQWLQLKNWCPVCKTSAAPWQTSSSL